MTASARRRWRLRSLLQRITRRLSARDPLAQSLRPAPRGPTDAGILFEPLEPRLLLSADFGDAPAPYPTTLAQNGAQHTVGTLKLGDGVDMESDGAPSVNADGDDTNGADDEDGVSFGAITVGALDATVTVNVQGAIGKLDAWIDFDGDGSWAGAAEHIFTSVDLALGNNDLTFDVPSWATAGTTYARFRLSTAGGLAPTGAAADGEVEDYAVTITNPTPASGVFASHLVSSTEGSIRKVITADVDGDGDMDLLSASYDLDEIAWFENDGAENFSKHVIDNAVDGAYSVVAVDFDGDGDIDVVSAAYAGNTIAWHENDGSQNFTTHVIDNAVPGAADVSIADMDGDGDLDVVFAARLIDLIAWYANNGDGTFFYHPVITSQPNGVISLATADLTGDGRIDILAGSSFSDDVILFVSGGPLANPTYTSITVGSMADDVRSIFVSDIDSDGDLDVVSTSVFDDRIAWYENDGVAVTPGFTTHTITDSAAAPWQAFAADIDGDGDVDLLAASAVGDTIAWYENDGNQQFTQHVLTTSADGAFSVFAADIDGDGDLDAVAASEADGTIAWFENLGFDYGDAPLPYPTTLAEDGPRHGPAGMILGTARDTEDDGVHSASADADDLDTADDEDGVTFGTIMVGALDATVAVTVTGVINTPTGLGRLDAWIDFNGDGSFDGPGEQIFDSLFLFASAQPYQLTYDVPSWAKAGTTYARFRVSTDGDLGPSGPAYDGEVEDYAVTIVSPSEATGAFGEQNIVTTDAHGTFGAFAADVDGDGDMDLLSASYGDNKIAWYENDGSQNFAPHTITAAASGAFAVSAADVDGDGDMDVLAAVYLDDTVAWYENDGSENFTPHTITTAANGANSVFSADLDGDGDLDVLGTSTVDDTVRWYENDGAENFTPHTISDTADGAYSVFAADIDGDGDLDVVSASIFDDTVAWYENNGAENFTEHVITTSADGAVGVFVADVDGDGDLDVLSASQGDNTIAWYENDGSENFTPHPISTSATGARAVFAADMDGDGDVDVLGSALSIDTVLWLENDGSEIFTPHTITTSADGVWGVLAADVDGDGDLDVISASYFDEKLAWYENLGYDFGDAPSPYPSSLADNGPRHGITGPTLGATRDEEPDVVIFTDNAYTDDSTGIADEDGVTFGVNQVGQLDATVIVNVQGGPAKLDAWIDFNGDGSWGGPGEQIFDSVDVVVGDNLLTFDVPSWAKAGETYARFRLSTAGDLGITGVADDGEVEDHRVVFSRPTGTFGNFSDRNIISDSAFGADSVFAADVDGDGDMDVLSASRNDDTIAWYENDGTANFTPHTITASADAAVSVFAADVDGDGDIDVLSASVYDDKIAWYENDGSENFTPHTITTTADGAFSVFAADVDGDGDMDVLSASGNDDTVAWYENDGAENFTPHTVTNTADGAFSVFAADVDGDGDLDVLSASFNDDKIAWYENDGSQNFTGHTITAGADGAWSVFAADVDGDGDMDVLSASYYDDKIAWYENDGSQVFTAHTIDAAADGVYSVFAADVNGDSRVDVLSASRNDTTIAWYENDGSQNFTKHAISTTADGYSVIAADVDGDGDLDVLIASKSDRTIAWYENQFDDYGDAPDNYGTLRESNGARHVRTGMTLGSKFDLDVDGQPSANADGDDLNGLDDDDGVTLGTIRVGALDATVTVNVQGQAGKLDAWIDFNGDGSFGGPGEQIFDTVDVALGDNVLTYDVPSWAIAGVTYARFRLSPTGNLAPTGNATGGEVEDYAVTIENAAATPGVFGGQNVIGTSTDHPFSVFAADIDGDGDMDMLSASQFDNKIAWYENDGSQNFTAHIVSTGALSAFSVFAADVDGDGDVDVLSASYNDSKIAWYENDGAQNFTEHTVGFATGAADVFAADVDGDGDLDVLSAAIGGNRIAWYENDGAQSFTAHTITTAANGAISVFAADMDSDGDMDVLSASEFDDKIAWYENDGTQSFTEHAITTTANGAIDVFAADVDGDGDIDVLSAAFLDDTIVWYENDGSQSFTPHTISADADGARSVIAVDIDGDGDIDVLSAEDYDNEIAWYENDGSQSFTPHSISTAASGATSVFAADVDGDGDLDVLSASRNDDKIAWYDNLGYDFGDAPSPYPTTLAEDGARHLDTGPTLGASRDAEADGTHSASADADDLIGVTPDDETGVTFGTIMVGALDATVTVNVQGGTGKLDAWIDFNGDGSFGGPGEHIFDSVDVMVGDNELTFDVPSWAVAGVTYARFRLSTAGDLAPSGAAADGEVEDYAVTIIDPAAASGVFGGENVVNNMADGASSVFAADIDGDGDMDMLSASSVDDTITWYENDGAQNFTPHTITTGADFAISVFAADVDGDGDVDVLSASSRDDTIAWYENDGAQNFTPHAISTADDVPASVFAADVDGDGDMDVLGAAFGSGIIWYENNGAQNFTPHVITNAYGAYSVFAADVDGDGDLDVIGALFTPDTIAWYENDGEQNFTPHTIDLAAAGPKSVFAADVDGDGDMDMLSASYFDDTIAWYENDGAENFTKHAITTTADGAVSAFAADVDGDGDTDVVGSSDFGTIAWYENDGAENFTTHAITTAINGATHVFVADVDGDGDLDVLSASDGVDTIAWHENLNFTLDVDGNGAAQPLTDGILIIRYLAGFTGTVLTSGAIGGGATRTDPTEIHDYLDASASVLDVDGDGAVQPLTDGILIIRYLAGFTDTVLTGGALGGTATRTDPAAIIAYLDALQPPASPPPLFAEQSPPEPAPLIAEDTPPSEPSAPVTVSPEPKVDLLAIVSALAATRDPSPAFINPHSGDPNGLATALDRLAGFNTDDPKRKNGFLVRIV